MIRIGGSPLGPVSLRVVDPAALRAQITARVNSLTDVLRQDVAGSRDALRELLQEPAKATAIRVNGSPKFLIQASLSHDAMCAEFSAFKSGGDPNLILREVVRGIRVEVVV